MLDLTVLSPHRDDAAFSLFLALSYWSSSGVRLRVVNFFTVSEYGPRVHSGALSVTTARRREDHRVLARIDGLAVHDLQLLDAPIRLGISPASVFEPGLAESIAQSEANALARRIRKYFRRGLVLAPLALGDHVDHHLVRRASIESSFAHKLGFYEDLPYAMWASDDVLRARVSECEDSTQTVLKPVVVRSRAFLQKRAAIAGYQSQIALADANAIARFASRYGGERIWIPKHSRAWSLVAH